MHVDLLHIPEEIFACDVPLTTSIDTLERGVWLKCFGTAKVLPGKLNLHFGFSDIKEELADLFKYGVCL